MDRIIADLRKLVEINSVSARTEQKECPFGVGVRKVLDTALDICGSYGFRTKNCDNMIGYAETGQGEELMGILVHLDVVPAGDGWTHDPFGGEIDRVNSRIWGRGAMDDKGPAICALYALKALKDEGFKPKRKIKLILGCNEESGWGCIDYYNKHAKMPEEGFSPDADFPVIYAEKGILHLKLKFEEGGSFTGLKGGAMANMVCDRCEVMAPLDIEKAAKYELESCGGKLVAHGKSAHGSTPEEGVNAIKPILEYLGLDRVCDKLFGECFSLKELCDETGRLTFSPNIIEQADGNIFVTCDIRYPASYKKEEVLKRITESGTEFEILSEQAPLFNDKNCFLIKTLCDVYNEVTGKQCQPVAIGGGTYARALKCGAAFGPEEQGEENTVHQANEYITFEKIEKCFNIYKLAIKRLTQ